MPRLQVLNGKRQGATFDVGRQGVVIGHRNTAPVSIDDPWVSWDHARIFVQNDAFWIEDLQSTNGTFVNCVRVKRERLNHEDIIFFGKTHVIFLVPDLQSVSNDADSSPSEERKRSSFEVNVEAIAAAALPASGPQPSRAVSRTGQNGRSQVGAASTGPAIPVRPDELAPLPPIGAATGLEPGEESSRSRRDPFRPGADPWEKRIPPNKGSSAIANLAPDADPFSSARSDPAKGQDPFSVGQDPFDAGKGQRSIADTQYDKDDAPPSSTRPTVIDAESTSVPARGFENFAIDENEPDNLPVAPVSAAEVSSLLEPSRNNKSNDGEEPSLDDLDALLGDNAARTPDPGLYRVPNIKKPSEALTRPIDTAAANAALAGAAPPPARRTSPSRTALDLGGPPIDSRGAPAAGSSRFVAPPLAPAPARSSTGKIAAIPPELGSPASNARTQMLTAQNPEPLRGGPSPSAPAPPPPAAGPTDEGRPVPTAELAFEVAKLQDEVRRLRMALEAARQGDPEKVRVAVEALRADELGRQAREIAELRKELAALQDQHAKTLAELDDVTSDMINKEDQIDALRAKLAEQEPGGRRAAAPGADLRALEF